jgi:hypothetical protein
MPQRLLDRDALNQEIDAIFHDVPGHLPPREAIEQDIETLVSAGRRGEVQRAAERVINLLSLDLDVLRKAALLSLLVRLTGKRNFDSVANHVLEKRTTYVTAPG